jgi:AcrR family transcriptional regulator
MTATGERAGVPTRDRLLDCARAHLDEHGLEGLSLRAVARRAGVSHAAPARHFPTVAALLAAVAAQGFRDLMRSVDERLRDAGPRARAIDRLRATGRAYVEFAISHRGVFELMFRADRCDTGDPEYGAAGAASFAQLVHVVQEAQADGFRPDVPSTQLAGTVWASMHGLAQLWLLGAIQGVTGCQGDRGLDELLAVSHRLLLAPPSREERS